MEALKREALKYLEEGRPNWDVPHTLATIHWIKELIKAEGGNEKILVSTMYLHDIDYTKKDSDYNSVSKSKEKHMVLGSKLAKEILSKLEYSEEEIKEIVHLVRVHDNIETLSSFNEILVFEADSLTQIDVERIQSTFNKDEIKRFLNSFEEYRLPRFKTNKGKALVKELFKKVKGFYCL